MPAPLEVVIKYVVRHAPRAVTKTSLMKLIFLGDYWSTRCYGERLVECRWEQDQYGIVAYAIPDTARHLADRGELQIHLTHNGAGGSIWWYLPAAADGVNPARFESHHELVLDYVLDRYGHCTAQRLGQLTKTTELWRKGAPRGTEVDMSLARRGCPPQDRPEIWLRRARIAYLDFSERGTPEDRAKHALSVYDSMAESRKRVARELGARG